jgi:hypothetical protein
MRTSTISTGTFLKNGANRYFLVTEITETRVSLQEHTYSGPSDKTLRMARNVFDGLYRNRNYAVVKYAYSSTTSRWEELTDRALDRKYSTSRYLIKQW